MFKTFEKYIIKNFFNKFLIITLVFTSLVIILSILEEISFFKDLEINFLYPYFLTLLGVPITLFEILPFIFLLSTQFVFYDLFKKEELNLLKINGLSNLKIIKILTLTSFMIGIFTVLIFYNLASKLKFFYTDIKNNFSNDNKYLAVVTDSGLWLKDEINNSTYIVKAILQRFHFAYKVNIVSEPPGLKLLKIWPAFYEFIKVIKISNKRFIYLAHPIPLSRVVSPVRNHFFIIFKYA